MSFNESLNKSINSSIKNYIEEISRKYSLDKKELFDLWMGESTPSVASTSHPELEKMTVKELIELCKVKGLKYSGTKPKLIGYLTQKEVKITPKKELSTISPVFGKIASADKIVIKKNSRGNLVHEESRLVFNPDTQKVIGKEQDNGTVVSITKDDINICNKYKFAFLIPENLNGTTTGESESKDELENLLEEDLEIEDDDEELEIEYDE